MLTVYGDGYVSHGETYVSHGDGYMSHGDGYVSHGDGYVSHGNGYMSRVRDLCIIVTGRDLSCLTTSLVGLVLA